MVGSETAESMDWSETSRPLSWLRLSSLFSSSSWLQCSLRSKPECSLERVILE